MDDVLSLAGRTAFVTGAARGIGAAIARAFAGAGARVALVDRDTDGVTRVAGEIGPAALGLGADVTDAAAIARVVDQVTNTWGAVDVLVNNAGIVRDAVLDSVSDEDWEATLDVNLRGALVCTRAVVPQMKARGFGRIVSASSIVARYGNYGQTAYAASKAGILGMTRVWARELGPAGITANAVAPGFIETEMTRGVPAKVMNYMLTRTPAGRLGTPAEVANVYLFLASDLASFVNGAVVGVDGGLFL